MEDADFSLTYAHAEKRGFPSQDDKEGVPNTQGTLSCHYIQETLPLYNILYSHQERASFSISPLSYRHPASVSVIF
ncbi:hypothetical protein B1690_07415 [Geobacillus sp. 46C-IIa]|nr:hypothetical protein B1690_07415 [Geobacillus sp. 46C-IIa]